MEYNLTEKEKKVHEVGLDLLAKVKEICEKHNLKYFANAGTLLGAARHKGFIPWDDDIDISMEWEDYKKFLEVAPKECTYPYYFQSHLTEPDSEVDHCKIRRSDTTGFSKWEYENIKNPSHNLGIWLDIFPMFNLPDDETIREEKKSRIMDYWEIIRGYNAKSCIEYGFEPNPNYVKYIEKYEEAAQKYTISEIKNLYLEECACDDNNSEEIGETSFRTFNDKFIYKREWYANAIEMPFENTTIRCPEKYEEILTKAYGDWRTPIINGAVHEMEHVDPEMPFSEYLKQKNS